MYSLWQYAVCQRTNLKGLRKACDPWGCFTPTQNAGVREGTCSEAGVLSAPIRSEHLKVLKALQISNSRDSTKDNLYMEEENPFKEI